MIHLTIPLSPVAKARPRVINGRAYTPTATASYERAVKLCAAHLTPLSGPIEAEIAFIFPRLKSATSTAREVKATRPDIDNLIKAILDGLNGLGFSDDGQVVQITASKWYAAADEEAHVEVKLCPFMREIQHRVGGGETRAQSRLSEHFFRSVKRSRRDSDSLECDDDDDDGEEEDGEKDGERSRKHASRKHRGRKHKKAEREKKRRKKKKSHSRR